MRKLLIFLILMNVFLISCDVSEKPSTEKEISGKIECSNNRDCTVGGCSGELCLPIEESEEIVSICLWEEEYKCLALTSCSCINRKCQWEENEVYRECMNSIKQIK